MAVPQEEPQRRSLGSFASAIQDRALAGRRDSTDQDSQISSRNPRLCVPCATLLSGRRFYFSPSYIARTLSPPQFFAPLRLLHTISPRRRHPMDHETTLNSVADILVDLPYLRYHT